MPHVDVVREIIPLRARSVARSLMVHSQYAPTLTPSMSKPQSGSQGTYFGHHEGQHDPTFHYVSLHFFALSFTSLVSILEPGSSSHLTAIRGVRLRPDAPRDSRALPVPVRTRSVRILTPRPGPGDSQVSDAQELTQEQGNHPVCDVSGWSALRGATVPSGTLDDFDGIGLPPCRLTAPPTTYVPPSSPLNSASRPAPWVAGGGREAARRSSRRAASSGTALWTSTPGPRPVTDRSPRCADAATPLARGGPPHRRKRGKGYQPSTRLPTTATPPMPFERAPVKHTVARPRRLRECGSAIKLITSPQISAYEVVR